MQISNRHLNLHKYIETVEDNLKKKKKKPPTGKTCLCHYSSVALLGLCAMEDRAKISVGNNNHPVPVLQKQKEYLEDLCFWTCLRRSRSASL